MTIPRSPQRAPRVDGQPRTGSQSVERAINVLYAFEGESRSLSISEVAGRVGLPVSTAHRIAQALVRGRLLARDGHNSYLIGDGIAALAHAASRRVDIDAMAPHLHILSSEIRITASLGVVEDGEAVTVYSARPPSMFCDHQLPSRRSAIEHSAMGQAIVAFGQRRERQLSPLPDIPESRRRGYSVATADGVTAIAVPVFGADGQVRASIGVQARSVRLNQNLISAIHPMMRNTAEFLRDVADIDSSVEAVLRATI
ncbi:IclR family transcriptional regulator [Gordonia sp. CPCC 205333]|uniref:IclR family transcriptional regulator n=1 Tax=Gordonia sp. CPCC 205333 TaxID=3140790 RepID=UPI003AF3AB45